ncbi:hypothetical protein Btru_040104 [Bulinus truncatus]|nr:hypothetical protein Btru_040104 [Bulinus truncatus]
MNEGCVCKKVEGKIYTLRYLSLANAMYSGNLIKINEANIGVKFPTIQKDVPVVVSLRVNGENVKGAADCQISLPAKSTASFAVCAEGVTAPELNLTYGGKVKTSKGENCLEANICTQSATETVYYSVHNSCHQDMFFSCSIQVHDVPETGDSQGTAGDNQGTARDNQGTAAPSSQGTMATENQGTKHQSTKPSHTEDDSDSGFLIKFIILVIVLLILTVLAVQLYSNSQAVQWCRRGCVLSSGRSAQNILDVLSEETDPECAPLNDRSRCILCTKARCWSKMSNVSRSVRSHISQANCLSTCTTYLLLAVLLSVKQSDEITYNVEFEKNQTSCKHGLIENRDTVHMSVTMYTKHGEVNSYTHFTLEAVHPKTNHSIMV